MTKPNYTPEIRERAVQLLIESEKDYPSTWAAITAIAPKIGCTPETLRAWHQKYLDQQNPAKVQQVSDQEKMKQMEREGYVIARCTVARLMQKLGIQGVWRGKNKQTTRNRDDQKRADDLVKRNFNADHPNQLWVGDFTYIQTHSGWVYTAFVIDVFSRAIVGWKVSTRMNTDMVLDALEQALHDRGMPKNVIHHSDRGVQYLSIRYTNRLEAANLRASVGTTGDSYDNALAETVNGLYKTEVIEYLKADWQGLADVQLATLNWVDWFNKKRVHSALGYVSPFEFEAMYYDKINPLGQVA